MTIAAILIKYREAFAQGLFVTLKLSLIVWFFGILGGTLLGIAGAKWRHLVGFPSRAISFLFSGIPILVLLFWVHFPLQKVLHVVIDPFYTGAAVLTIINLFAVSDTVRGALNDFPAQYLVAAAVCGLKPWDTVRRIQLPLIFRQVLPALLILQVNMLQATLFTSLISVEEIFRVVQRVDSNIYQPVELYSTLGIFFLAICLPLNGIALWLRIKFTRNISET